MQSQSLTLVLLDEIHSSVSSYSQLLLGRLPHPLGSLSLAVSAQTPLM